jgi:hypothetical protein
VPSWLHPWPGAYEEDLVPPILHMCRASRPASQECWNFIRGNEGSIHRVWFDYNTDIKGWMDYFQDLIHFCEIITPAGHRHVKRITFNIRYSRQALLLTGISLNINFYFPEVERVESWHFHEPSLCDRGSCTTLLAIIRSRIF